MSDHQIAKPMLATMAVRTVEINNESAASLIQSVTIGNSRRLHCRVPQFCRIFFVLLWTFAQNAVAIYHRSVIVERQWCAFCAPRKQHLSTTPNKICRQRHNPAQPSGDRHQIKQRKDIADVEYSDRQN